MDKHIKQILLRMIARKSLLLEWSVGRFVSFILTDMAFPVFWSISIHWLVFPMYWRYKGNTQPWPFVDVTPIGCLLKKNESTCETAMYIIKFCQCNRTHVHHGLTKNLAIVPTRGEEKLSISLLLFSPFEKITISTCFLPAFHFQMRRKSKKGSKCKERHKRHMRRLRLYYAWRHL